MKKLILNLAVVCSLVGVTQAYAEMTPETIKCGDTIARGGERFQETIRTRLVKCLLAVDACEGDEACLEKLLAVGLRGALRGDFLPNYKGKCHCGKVDGCIAYFGYGSSDYHISEYEGGRIRSRIGKAYVEFIHAVDKACFRAAANLGPSPDGLGFIDPVPASVHELFARINGFTDAGLACKAHEQVLAFVPNRDALATLLYGDAVGDSPTAIGIQNFVYDSPCK